MAKKEPIAEDPEVAPGLVKIRAPEHLVGTGTCGCMIPESRIIAVPVHQADELCRAHGFVKV